ncbi:MAG: hypothetical protein WDW38_003168 [Sanguina aurantia]
MDITFKTVLGNIKLESLSPDLPLEQLKQLLRSKAEHAVPPPEQQRLMLRATVLGSAGTLATAGLSSGDSIVVLATPRPLPPPAPDRTTTPTLADIKVAIVAEAKRRGIEGQLRPDAPTNPRTTRAFGLLELASRDGLPDLLQMDGQLLQLIEVLQGRLSEARSAAQGPPVPDAPVVIPQPPAAALAQLTEMGFAEQLSRNALQLQRNNVAAALDWLLQHGEEPGAAEPLSEERLQQIYGRPARAPAPSETDMVQQLVEMGFTGDQSEAALRRYRDIDLALAHLLRRSGVDLPNAAAAPPSAATAAAAAAAAGARPLSQPPPSQLPPTQPQAAPTPSSSQPASQRSPSSLSPLPSCSTPASLDSSLLGAHPLPHLTPLATAAAPGAASGTAPNGTSATRLSPSPSALSASIASLRLFSGGAALPAAAVGGETGGGGDGAQQQQQQARSAAVQVTVGSHALHAEGDEEFASSEASPVGGGVAAAAEEDDVVATEEEYEQAEDDEGGEYEEGEDEDEGEYEEEGDEEELSEDDGGDGEEDGEGGGVEDLFFGSSEAVNVLRAAGAQHRALLRAQEEAEAEGMMAMPMQAGHPMLMGLAPNPYDSGSAVFNTPPGSMEEDGGYGGSGWSERAHQAMTARLQHTAAMTAAMAQQRAAQQAAQARQGTPPQ